MDLEYDRLLDRELLRDDDEGLRLWRRPDLEEERSFIFPDSFLFGDGERDPLRDRLECEDENDRERLLE